MFSYMIYLCQRDSTESTVALFFLKGVCLWTRLFVSVASHLPSSFFQPAEQLRRVIGDDDVSACSTQVEKQKTKFRQSG